MEELPSNMINMELNSAIIGIIVFVVTGIIYTIFSIILVYHWRQYAVGAKIISLTLRSYFISTAVLFITALGSLFFI